MQYPNDASIINTALTWLQQAHTVILITVAQTWGSSPRPAGSLMLIRDDGQHTGSVSGGCVEEDLLSRFQQRTLAQDFPSGLSYGVQQTQAQRLGLPCGGRLELVLELLTDPAELQPIVHAIQAQQLIQRQVCLHSGRVTYTQVQHSHVQYQAQQLSKVFGNAWHLLMIGAGHLSYGVAQIALMLDYRVTVCDPREHYGPQWALDGTQFTAIMPDDAVDAYADHPQSAIVALSHDPKIDDMGLMQALNSRAFYIGALGSKRNSETRRQRLHQLGLSSASLQQLSAPIGLPIGSHTAAEIAVSIMAEITAVRHQVPH